MENQDGKLDGKHDGLEEKKDAVSKALKLWRSLNDITQEQLAYTLGVSHQQVMRWETKRSLPNNLSTKALKELKILP